MRSLDEQFELASDLLDHLILLREGEENMRAKIHLQHINRSLGQLFRYERERLLALCQPKEPE